jgi:hypothetical protein
MFGLRRLALLAIMALCRLLVADAAAADAARRDDAYHVAQFADGQHDANYAEWWYFNLSDAAQGLDFAFTYAVLDPANLTGFGLSSVTAIGYTPAGHFTETAPDDGISRIVRTGGSADCRRISVIVELRPGTQ